MHVRDIADGPEISSAGDIDAPRGVALHGPFAYFNGVVLTPCLVKRNPKE